MFGGNPGDVNYARDRLDDFWELKLKRPAPSDILRKVDKRLLLVFLRLKCCPPPPQKKNRPCLCFVVNSSARCAARSTTSL